MCYNFFMIKIYTTKSLIKDITVRVNIYKAQEYLVTDVALMDLFHGDGDKNKTKLTEEDFKKEVSDGNVIVAMLEEDPIAYAIVHDGKVVEHYIEYDFRNSNLEKELLSEAITL